MENIISYLKKQGHQTFLERAFNDVDSLIVAQLSYLIYDNYLDFNREKSIPFSFFNDSEKIVEITKNTLEPAKNIKLLEALFQSKRFQKMTIENYYSEISYDKVIQFAAMVFRFGEDLTYIAFRGTDVTFLGWKEDFNMAYYDVVPGQAQSVAYIERVMSYYSQDKHIVVGGHSKGGNLALYAATFCCEEIQKRIEIIYNHDGPGFRRNLFETQEFQKIANKLQKTVPHDSLIGMILNHYDQYKVVKSYAISGLLQHDPFNWGIKGTEFITYQKVSKRAQILEKSISMWLENISNEDRRQIIDDLFSLFEESEIVNVTDFKKQTLKKLRLLKRRFKNLPNEDKEQISKKLDEFVKLYIKNSLDIPIFKKKKLEKETKM